MYIRELRRNEWRGLMGRQQRVCRVSKVTQDNSDETFTYDSLMQGLYKETEGDSGESKILMRARWDFSYRRATAVMVLGTETFHSL